MNNYDRLKLAAIYLYHFFAFAGAKDLRHDFENERYFKSALMLVSEKTNRTIDQAERAIKVFGKKLKLENMPLEDIDKLFRENYKACEELMKYHFHPKFATCCDSCNWGSSDTPKSEIGEQRKKYGMFICKDCESIIADIDNCKYDMFAKRGFYHSEGLRDPNGAFLGFGGSYYLIRKTNGKIEITNSLFSDRSMHSVLSEQVKDKWNCEIYFVSSFRKEDLIKHISELEFDSLTVQIKRAKELGLKTD